MTTKRIQRVYSRPVAKDLTAKSAAGQDPLGLCSPGYTPATVCSPVGDAVGLPNVCSPTGGVVVFGCSDGSTPILVP